MNCAATQDLLSAYIDNECTNEETIATQMHLETCSECQAVYHMIQSLVEQMNQIEEKEVPDGFRIELMHKLHQMSPKKNHFASWRRMSTVLAASFLFVLIFGVIGSSLFLQFTTQKKSDSAVTESAMNYGAATTSAATMQEAAIEDPHADAPLTMDLSPTENNDLAMKTNTESLDASDNEVVGLSAPDASNRTIISDSNELLETSATQELQPIETAHKKDLMGLILPILVFSILLLIPVTTLIVIRMRKRRK